MQPSYALLEATSYPKTVGRMCYAIIRAHTKRVKTTISNYPIIDQGSQTCYPGMLSADRLSQHAITQS